jgi:predicted phosphodiesterase
MLIFKEGSDVPGKHSLAGMEAQRLVKEYPDTDSMKLARRLSKEFTMTINSARCMIRYYRGAHGKARRRHRVVVRPLGKSGQKPKCPPSQCKPWEPFVCNGKRILILSDIHIPYHDETAINGAVEWGKKQRPDTVILNGDTIDFYQLSRFLKDPRKRSAKGEIDLTKDFLGFLVDQFPKAKLIYKKGNHDERWDHYLWNHAPELCDFENVQLRTILEFDRLGIEMIEDQRPITCGKLPVFHGHELPKGMTNPVNMARGAYLRMADTVLVGHGHRTSSHSEPNWKHEEVATWSTGCLCGLNPEYSRINKWNHGFAFVEVSSSGEFGLQNLRISEGKVRPS